LRGADPAAVWALVADPERISEWAPVHQVGFMGTELPAVGHSFFVTLRKGVDASKALRFEISEWDAGHRYRCTIQGSRVAEVEQIDVIVTSEVDEGRPAANFELRYAAEVPAWLAPIRRYEVRRRLHRAVESVERIIGHA
jgi:hypothetical protein